MPTYPNRLRIRTGNDGGTVFELEPELYTVRTRPAAGPQGESTVPGGAPVAVVAEGATSSYAVYGGTPARDLSDAAVGPVYSAGRGGPLAIPTGRVLVRLVKGERPGDRTQAFASAGFEIEKTLSYAPSTAWLTPRGGDVAHALNNLDALERMTGVEHVEPQLLMERGFRHG